MSNSNKFIEAKSLKSLHVQEFKPIPFEGTYICPKQGAHGTNYVFYSEGHYVEVYGVKALHDKMVHVKPGCEVKITYLQEVKLNNGNKLHDIKVGYSENVVEGFDLTSHLSECAEYMD